jgi:hypothetical protein
VKLGEAEPPNEGAVTMLEGLKLDKPGPIYLFVSFDRRYGYPAGDYSLAIGPGEIDSPPKPPAR